MPRAHQGCGRSTPEFSKVGRPHVLEVQAMEHLRPYSSGDKSCAHLKIGRCLLRPFGHVGSQLHPCVKVTRHYLTCVSDAFDGDRAFGSASSCALYLRKVGLTLGPTGLVSGINFRIQCVDKSELVRSLHHVWACRIMQGVSNRKGVPAQVAFDLQTTREAFKALPRSSCAEKRSHEYHWCRCQWRPKVSQMGPSVF